MKFFFCHNTFVVLVVTRCKGTTFLLTLQCVLQRMLTVCAMVPQILEACPRSARWFRRFWKRVRSLRGGFADSGSVSEVCAVVSQIQERACQKSMIKLLRVPFLCQATIFIEKYSSRLKPLILVKSGLKTGLLPPFFELLGPEGASVAFLERFLHSFWILKDMASMAKSILTLSNPR